MISSPAHTHVCAMGACTMNHIKITAYRIVSSPDPPNIIVRTIYQEGLGTRLTTEGVKNKAQAWLVPSLAAVLRIRRHSMQRSSHVHKVKIQHARIDDAVSQVISLSWERYITASTRTEIMVSRNLLIIIRGWGAQGFPPLRLISPAGLPMRSFILHIHPGKFCC